MSKGNKTTKTNAVRLLDAQKIDYTLQEYDTTDGHIDGVSVAHKTGQDPKTVYKTLVTMANPTELFVCIIPVEAELDLKKAAKAAGVKKLEMLPLKDLLAKTGYIRGGCSPIGMKKLYPTFIQEDAKNLSFLLVSAGKVGMQVKLDPQDLQSVTNATFTSIMK